MQIGCDQVRVGKGAREHFAHAEREEMHLCPPNGSTRDEGAHRRAVRSLACFQPFALVST